MTDLLLGERGSQEVVAAACPRASNAWLEDRSAFMVCRAILVSHASAFGGLKNPNFSSVLGAQRGGHSADGLVDLRFVEGRKPQPGVGRRLAIESKLATGRERHL